MDRFFAGEDEPVLSHYRSALWAIYEIRELARLLFVISLFYYG